MASSIASAAVSFVTVAFLAVSSIPSLCSVLSNIYRYRPLKSLLLSSDEAPVALLTAFSVVPLAPSVAVYPGEPLAVFSVALHRSVLTSVPCKVPGSVLCSTPRSVRSSVPCRARGSVLYSSPPLRP